ncbi:MAG: rRNA (guanine527-N7)-methyltransferase, partial [Solirubrobacteraceae bacterium]|nr:rRNA (guanine527-N7)-methyltransferase [Solirubrobacteraceae bacterium]
SQKRLEELAGRYGLEDEAVGRLARLLLALAEEPDPHTTVADPDEAVDVHVADSLSGLEIEELRRARWVADLGAGAGFPGLALAVALPGAWVDLIESTGRKADVIRRLIDAGSIENARAVTARAEEWAKAPAPIGGRGAYEVVTARAVAPIPVLVEYAAPLLRDGGVLIAWKTSEKAAEEEAGAKAAVEVGLSLEAVVEVKPWPEARDRRLHVFRKVAPTPERFPRRAGMAVKRPLG